MPRALIAHDAFIQKKPKAAQGLVTGVVKALKWIKTATAEQVRAALPEDYWRDNPDLYLESIRKNLSGLSVDGLITKSEAEGVYKTLLAEDKQIDLQKIDFASTFDNTFAERANAR